MKHSLKIKAVFTTSIAAVLGLISADASAMNLRGTITKDNHTKAVGFNLSVGDDSLRYKVVGNSLSVPRFWSISRVDANFQSIRVYKEGYANGQYAVQNYANWGSMYFHPRLREIPSMMLAGVSVRGSFVSGALDAGLDFEDLVVDNHASFGTLDYSSFNGYLTPVRNVRFGDNAIRPFGDGGRFVYNYDNYSGQNTIQADFSFGNLRVQGSTQFSDRTSRHESCSRDSDGDEQCTTTTVVDATRGSVNWTIGHADGSPLQFAQPNEAETADDAQIRSLIAFLQLTTADITVFR